MGKYEFSKVIPIQYKKLSEDDILQIAKLFCEQFADGDYEREIRLTFEDDSKVMGEDIEIFSIDQFKRRRCKSVCFGYRSKHFERKLDISIYNAEMGYLDSKIEVVSTDQMWYESIINRYMTLFDEVENQKKLEKPGYTVVSILTVVEAALFNMTIQKMYPAISNANDVLISVGSTIVLMILNTSFLLDILKLYPKTEFNFGPEHKNKINKTKKYISIIVPFVLDFLFFIIGFAVK